MGTQHPQNLTHEEKRKEHRRALREMRHTGRVQAKRDRDALDRARRHGEHEGGI